MFSKLTKLARSPQGQKALRQAQDYAKSPEGKRKVADLRSKLQGGKKPR
jgi:hypothetical protein